MAALTSIIYVPVPQPYVPPAPYVPPPPAPVMPNMVFQTCNLCGALLYSGCEASHSNWHRVNGFHGWNCAELKSLIDQEVAINSGADNVPTIESCDCGLAEEKEH